MARAARISNEQAIYQWLRAKYGLTKAQAAGVLGNFQVESGFRTTAANPGEGAIGIAQWERGRRVALDAYVKAHGETETSLQGQLGYLAQELAGPYHGVLSEIRSTNNPRTVAAIWRANFEGAAAYTTTARQNAATAIFGQIQAGQTLTGGNGSHNPGAILTAAGNMPTPIFPWITNYKDYKAGKPDKLAPAARSKVITWLVSLKGKPYASDPNAKWGTGNDAKYSDRRWLQTQSDKQLVALARAAYQATTGYSFSGNPKMQPPGNFKNGPLPDPISGPLSWLEQGLTWLGHKLENIALIVLGLILVIVALVILAKSGDRGSSSSPTVVAGGKDESAGASEEAAAA